MKFHRLRIDCGTILIPKIKLPDWFNEPRTKTPNRNEYMRFYRATHKNKHGRKTRRLSSIAGLGIISKKSLEPVNGHIPEWVRLCRIMESGKFKRNNGGFMRDD